MWKQHSRVDWLHEGDHNTRFFHSFSSKRRRTNILDWIQDDDKIWVVEPIQVTNVVRNYFTTLFTTSNPPIQDDILGLVHTKVTKAERSWLESPYSEEEIYEALKDTNPHKVLGLNGLRAEFFQRFWSKVKVDVLRFCLDILNYGASVQEVNHTFIALIPKASNADSMKKLRPISLCNVLYKLIAKAVSNHVKVVVPSVISEEQSVFIKERLITDNALIAYEILHSIKNKSQGREGRCAIKLDMPKAYDRIEWSFVEKMLSRLGFAERFRATILDCITTVTYQPLINGVLLEIIVPQRGLR